MIRRKRTLASHWCSCCLVDILGTELRKSLHSECPVVVPTEKSVELLLDSRRRGPKYLSDVSLTLRLTLGDWVAEPGRCDEKTMIVGPEQRVGVAQQFNSSRGI